MKILQIFCALVFLCVAFGATASAQGFETKIKDTFAKNGINLEVLDSQNLGHGLKLVTISVEGGMSAQILATDDGKVALLAESIFSGDEKFSAKLNELTQKFEQDKKEQIFAQLSKVFDAQKSNVFTFKSSSKNASQTTFIVTDPMCPYCLKELENLPNRLKNSDVKILVVGFLKEQSLHKAAEILSQKSNNEKANLALFQKVYNPQYISKFNDEKQLKNAREITQAVMKSGVHSVPFVVVK